MRLYLIMLAAFAFYGAVSAQAIWPMKYSTCSNCPPTDNKAVHSTNYSYSSATNYEPLQVTSDYGPRILGQYDWHNGVDLRPYPPGNNDNHRGTAIQSFTDGDIVHIKFLHNGYKYIVIDDTGQSTGQLYGYGHIFNSMEVPLASDPMPLLSDGNFLMKRLDFNNMEVGIFCKTTGRCLSTLPNSAFTLPATAGSYAGVKSTVNTVTQDEYIAPMGGSGGSFQSNDPWAVHLHFYQLSSNPGDNAASSHQLCTDACEHLDLMENTQHDVDLSLAPSGVAYNQQGNAETSLRVRSTMLNATMQNRRFSNVVMKIIETQVRLSSVTITSGQLIEGPWYE